MAMAMEVEGAWTAVDASAPRQLSCLTLQFVESISGSRATGDRATLPRDSLTPTMTYDGTETRTTGGATTCSRPYPVLAVTRNPSFRLSGRDSRREQTFSGAGSSVLEGGQWKPGVINVVVNGDLFLNEGPSEATPTQGIDRKKQGVASQLVNSSSSGHPKDKLEPKGIDHIIMPQAHRAQRDTQGLPTWPSHPLGLEVPQTPSLDPSIPPSRGVTPRVVSDGFWKSIKLTPGELALERNKSHFNVKAQNGGVRVLGLPLLETNERERCSTAQKSPRAAEDAWDYDPDKISMIHIVNALRGGDQTARRQRIQADNRVEILDKCGSVYRLGTMEMALKTARRYRHPERPLANMPMTPGQPMTSNRQGKGAWGQGRTRTATTPLEQAMRVRSSTYAFQQQEKDNRNASRSSLDACRPTTNKSQTNRFRLTSSPARLRLLPVRKTEHQEFHLRHSPNEEPTRQEAQNTIIVPPAGYGQKVKTVSYPTILEHNGEPETSVTSIREDIIDKGLPKLVSLTSSPNSSNLKLGAGSGCKTPFNSPVGSYTVINRGNGDSGARPTSY